MKEDLKKHSEHVLRTCEQEQARFATRERQVRSNQRMRAAMIIIVVLVILIIALVIAVIMRESSMFIVAGVASGLALLSLIQLVPFRLGYTRVKQGYVVTSCFQVLRRCNYIPDEHKGKPVIGIAAGVFRDRKKMYYISLPEGMTHLGKEWFMNCRDLRGVNRLRGVGKLPLPPLFVLRRKRGKNRAQRLCCLRKSRPGKRVRQGDGIEKGDLQRLPQSGKPAPFPVA